MDDVNEVNDLTNGVAMMNHVVNYRVNVVFQVCILMVSTTLQRGRLPNGREGSNRRP